MPDDYNTEVSIQGDYLGAPTTVAVDQYGQLYSLMVGANGVVVAVDSGGKIQSVMQGQFGTTTKTLLCDADGRLLAQLMGMFGSTPIPIACDAGGRLTVAAFDQTNISPDSSEAQTLDTPLVSIVSNLNRMRHWIVALSGETWGTVTTSTATLWAKFHTTTGHTHTGAAGDAPILPYSGLSGKPDTDLTPYTKIDGTRAFTGDQSLGTHKLTSVSDPGVAQDAATKNYVDAIGQAWQSWTPVLTWSGATPSGVTVLAFWTRVGRLVFVNLRVNAANSMGCTNLTVSIPVSAYNSGSFYIQFGREYCGVGLNAIVDPMPAIDYINNVVYFDAFTPGVNGQEVVVKVFGFYQPI